MPLGQRGSSAGIGWCCRIAQLHEHAVLPGRFPLIALRMWSLNGETPAEPDGVAGHEEG